MYCIECGAQISDNSKFCSHCGYKQTEGAPSTKEEDGDVKIEKEISRQVVEAHKSSPDYQFLKKVMGWYLAWVLYHLGLLLIVADKITVSHGYGYDSNDKFWPFSENSHGADYDIREFLVYSIFPLATLVIWSMVRTRPNTDGAETNTEK
jgi:hypothetical protein